MKLVVTTKSVNDKLEYMAALSTLPIAEFKDIDKIKNGMYRKLTKNMATFQTYPGFEDSNDTKITAFGRTIECQDSSQG